jgi:hypothetical protein
VAIESHNLVPCCGKAKKAASILSFGVNGRPQVWIYDDDGDAIKDVTFCPFCGKKFEMVKVGMDVRKN